jgi:hypothetical protein
VYLSSFHRNPVVAACRAIFRSAGLRRDLAPDHLGRCNGPIFERDGFCFTISLDREDGRATFTMMYQSRFTGRSVAQVALRPSGSSLAVYSPRIECGPAAFGVAKFPAAIPARHQGKLVSFDIGADVDYPISQGREVRLHPGRAVRHNSQFSRLPAASWTLPVWPFEIILIKVATMGLRLPMGVKDELANNECGHAEELWSMSVRTYSPRTA